MTQRHPQRHDTSRSERTGLRSRLTIREQFLALVGLASLVVVASLSALRISTSSLMLHRAGDESNTARLLFGVARGIRADEWNRGSPDLLGRLSTGWTPEFRSIFEARSSFGGALEWLADFVHEPEKEILGRLLGPNAFFALWWLPIALAFVSGVAVFMLWGLPRLTSVLASTLILVVPTSSWWSYHPLQLLWPVLTAIALIQLASRLRHSDEGRSLAPEAHPSVVRSRLVEYSCVVLAGVVAARLPFGYFPWALPTAIVVGALLLDLIAWQRSWRKNLSLYLVALGAFSVAVVFKLAVSWSKYTALANTVYPGGRRSEGGDLRQPLFTTAQSFFLQREETSSMVGTNQSEAALGPLLIPVIACALALFFTVLVGTRSARRLGVPLISLAATATLLLWALIPWPPALLSVNPLVLLPGYRLAQILGVIALVPALISLSQLSRLLQGRGRHAAAALAGAITVVISVQAGVAFTASMPRLSINEIWISSALFAACVWALLAYFPRPVSLAPLVLFFVASSLWINPFVHGLGDIRNSEVAGALRDTRASTPMEDARIATDDFQLDALAVANGFPMASGQVYWGPNEPAWKVLDPGAAYVDAWNRGAMSLRFEWEEARPEPLIWSPASDIAIITIDPCSPLLGQLGVRWIAASRPLTQPCLVEQRRFVWMGTDRWLYASAS